MAPLWRRSRKPVRCSTVLGSVVIFIAVATGTGAMLSLLSGLPFWTATAFATGSLLLNGIVATFEDDMPGGFNNPTGDDTPPYVTIVSRWVRVLSITALLITGLGFIYQGFMSDRPGSMIVGMGLGGTSYLLAALLASRRRCFLYAAAGCLAGTFGLPLLIKAIHGN